MGYIYKDKETPRNTEPDKTCSLDRKAEALLLYFLVGLVLILPVDHTITLRASLFVGCLFLWLNKIRRTGKLHVRQTPLDIPLLLYMITIVISFFTSLKLSSSLQTFKGEFLTNTVLFYLVVANIYREDQVKKIITALLFGSAVMAVYGIIDFFIKGGSLLDIHYRTGSLHQGYEAYAQYIIMVLPFNLLGILYAGNRGSAVLSLLAGLNIFALYLTHTRGAWLACWLEMFILCLFVLKGKPKIIIGGLLILIPAAALLVLPANVVWHGKKVIYPAREENFQDNTGTIRLTMWKEALRSLSDEPFTGAGYGKGNIKRKFSGKIFASYEQAHNTFINTAVQLGVQGLAALLLIILVILKITNSGWKRSGNSFEGLYFLGVFTMTIGFFTACQFAEFFIDDTARLFWILVGLAFSLYVRANKVESFKNSVHPS